MIHKAVLEAAYNSVCGVKHVVELFQPCSILEQHSAQRGYLPLVFLLTQKLSGSMVFADQWSVLMGGILLLQGALVALGFKKA